MAFVEALKGQHQAKIIISGEPGTGKSWSSLALASHLIARGNPELVKPNPMLPGGFQFSRKLSPLIGVIESENRSREYAGGRPFWFSVEELTTFGPEQWIEALSCARRRGFQVVIFDSFSDEWRGKGGMLQLVESERSSIEGWKKQKPIHWKLIDAIKDYPGHIIVTCRSKSGISIGEDPISKRKTITRTAPQMVQEDELGFRLSFWFDMTSVPERGAVLTVRKSVAETVLNEEEYDKPGRELADKLNAWCEVEGEEISTYERVRRALVEAANKKELKKVWTEILALKEAEKLTIRENESLTEIAAIVQYALKKNSSLTSDAPAVETLTATQANEASPANA